MITAAGLCPWPPILVRELTGVNPVLPELRDACAQLIKVLIDTRPDLICVVGPGDRTKIWPSDSRLDLALFAPRGSTSASSLPTSLGIGSYLLDQADYHGPRVLQSVSGLESRGTCVRLGRKLASADERIAMLAMGDGSARRSPRAPGHHDSRAETFDTRVVRALEAVDIQALGQVSGDLARDLMANGRVVWQILAGALRDTSPEVEVLYNDDPFGILYFVGLYIPNHPASQNSPAVSG